MVTATISVTLARIKRAEHMTMSGVVKMTHQPTGQVYFILGKMYPTTRLTLNQLKNGSHLNFRLQKLYDKEVDFQFDFYDHRSAGLTPTTLKRQLMSDVPDYLLI